MIFCSGARSAANEAALHFSLYDFLLEEDFMRLFGALLLSTPLVLGSLAGCNSKKTADDGSSPRAMPPNMKTKQEGKATPNMPPVPPPPPKSPPNP